MYVKKRRCQNISSASLHDEHLKIDASLLGATKLAPLADLLCAVNDFAIAILVYNRADLLVSQVVAFRYYAVSELGPKL